MVIALKEGRKIRNWVHCFQAVFILYLFWQIDVHIACMREHFSSITSQRQAVPSAVISQTLTPRSNLKAARETQAIWEWGAENSLSTSCSFFSSAFPLPMLSIGESSITHVLSLMPTSMNSH